MFADLRDDVVFGYAWWVGSTIWGMAIALSVSNGWYDLESLRFLGVKNGYHPKSLDARTVFFDFSVGGRFRLGPHSLGPWLRVWATTCPMKRR